MRTDAAVCPRGGGQARGSAPGNPGRGAASTLRKARAALAGASRPLTRRRVFSGGLPPKKTLGRIVKDGGFSVAQRKVFFYFTSERTSFAQPPHQSKVLGRWEVGVGEEGGSPSSEGLPPPPPARRISPYQAVQRWRHSGMILPCSLRSVRNLSDSSGLVKVKSER